MNKVYPNVLFAHSGGVTSVVNLVASTLYNCCQQHQQTMYCTQFGINGLLSTQWVDASTLSSEEWSQISHTPGSCFGSSRLGIERLSDQLFTQLEKHQIGTFICNGGNGSQTITQQLHNEAVKRNYPLTCIGIPKTIDNDLCDTDCCPGYGSAAKYTAISVAEVALDVASMCKNSTQVLIYEAMGRSAGWLAAASALAKTHPKSGPHIILLPEANFSIADILSKTQDCINKFQHCIICIAEGAYDREHKLSSTHLPISIQLSTLIQNTLQVKTRTVIPDYLQRSARHITSEVDTQQTIALTQAAYDLSQSKISAKMVTVQRQNQSPYQWSTSYTDLSNVANQVRLLPSEFVSDNQLYVSAECIAYLTPLISGEVYPPYHQGLPHYASTIFNQL